MLGVQDPVEREQLTINSWERIKKKVDQVWKSGGTFSNANVRQTDRWQDCFSEACLGFVKGLNSWDPDKPKQPQGYCLDCAANQVKDWLRRTNRWQSNEPQLSIFCAEDNGDPLSWEELFSDNKTSTEEQLIFKQRVSIANHIVIPLHKKWDKIDRAIYRDIIIARYPKRQDMLAKYFKLSQQAISLREIKIRNQLRQEDL
jgi:RNA polymerase sigma factor (sigma-70 family)